MTNKTTEVRDALHPEYVRAISKESPIAAHIVESIKAAANKAAEEGGLTVAGLASVIDSMGWALDDVEKADMYILCCAAIAADRASRQVANKEEVDPIYQYKDKRGGGWIECDSEKRSIIRENGHESWYEFRTLYAAPPATTGASTAPDRHPWFCAHCQAGVPSIHVTCEEFHDPKSGGCGYRVGGWPELASTVLTDERIMALYDEAIGKGGSADHIIRVTARSIERETMINALVANDKKIDPVAAQAGQVAPAEIPSSAPAAFARRYTEMSGENRKLKARVAELEAGQVAVPGQAEIEWSHDVQERLIAAGDVESDEVRGLMAEAASLLAALTGRPSPSPAKESK